MPVAQRQRCLSPIDSHMWSVSPIDSHVWSVFGLFLVQPSFLAVAKLTDATIVNERNHIARCVAVAVSVTYWFPRVICVTYWFPRVICIWSVFSSTIFFAVAKLTDTTIVNKCNHIARSATIGGRTTIFLCGTQRYIARSATIGGHATIFFCGSQVNGCTHTSIKEALWQRNHISRERGSWIYGTGKWATTQ